MRSPSRALTWLGLAALAARALSASASAAPVVYTMQGTVVPVANDPLGLSGATLVWVATADTGDTPTEVLTDPTDPGVIQGRYPVAAVGTFSNRPGGAPDLVLNYEASFLTFNRFSPEPAADSFSLDNTGIRLPGNPTTFDFFSFNLYFQNQEFFPGSEVAPLPLFGPGDVASLTVDCVKPSFDLTCLYPLTNTSVTAVPEPASALLLASGLAALSIRRRAA